MIIQRIFATGVLAALLMPVLCLAQPDLDKTRPRMPDISITRGRGRGTEPLDKLSPSLRMLYEQFAAARGGSGTVGSEDGIGGFTSEQLQDTFGISGSDRDPLVTLAVTTSGKADDLTKAGGTVIARAGNIAYVMARISKVSAISSMRSVTSIGVMTAMAPPPVPRDEKPTPFTVSRGGPPPRNAPTLYADQFNKQGFTGKGVIVGVIDTGIDWRHPDFTKPDGTSRIIAIWDLADQSYQQSNGAVGSKPPVFLEDTKTWLGTVYTNAQINAAINGRGKVNSADRYGHGTAVAGTAASNGRADGNGVRAGTFAGVAPEADLLVVKAADCGSFLSVAELTAEWMTQTADSLGRPIVINMSFGSHYGGHDGTLEGEQFIDSVTGPGKPGKVITVSAGNEGQYSLHAGGRFGPARRNQADNFSTMIELFVKNPGVISATFDARDDWGLSFRGTNPMFRGADGKPATIFLYKDAGGVSYRTEPELNDPELFADFFAFVQRGYRQQGTSTDMLDLQLPAGNYNFWGFGAGPQVKNGRFELYSVSFRQASFGIGTEKSGMVGSPGNARNAITVGSYDFRDRWENLSGETSLYNLLIGAASGYTSPGPRRDGLVKPDITSPARYTISTLSSFSAPANGGCQGSMATDADDSITRDGQHIAWQGTSASAPFTAGVIALMLQKNPKLDAEQIRQILKKTARRDGTVGSVPNPQWGWGMIDPAAAIAATPAPGVQKRKPK